MPERPPDEALERSTNRWMVWGLVLIALAILAFPAYRLYEPSGRAEARETLIASLETQGEHLFVLNCAACHGADGLGGTGPALNSEQFLASDDEQIRQLIAVGVPGSQMSAYSLDFGGPLTLEQIDALATYLRSLEGEAPDYPGWRTPLEEEPAAFPVPPTLATTTTIPEAEPPEPTGTTEPGGPGAVVARGAEVYDANCAVCHGDGLGGGVGPALGPGSQISGQSDDAVRAVIVAGRGGMPAWGGALSASDIDAVIEFLRSEQG